MRADRLLSILLLLQTHHRMTASSLARRLEVSPRTIHRDMEALSMAGVPVYAERGAGGGWVLPDSFRTELTGLTEPEIRALFVTMPAKLLADLGLDRASDAALVKVLAALPSVARGNAEQMRQRIHVDGAGWRQAAEEVPALPLLQEAVWVERRVRLHYTRNDGETRERIVDPLGLVAKGRLWYLVAAVKGEPRTFRVSRAQDAEILDEPFTRPSDFDLAAYWAQSSAELLANLPTYPITVRIAPDVVRRLWIPGAYARIEHVGEPEADGWQTARLILQTEYEACSYALGFGPKMEVLEPPALRDRVIREARAICEFYVETERQLERKRELDRPGGGQQAGGAHADQSDGTCAVPVPPHQRRRRERDLLG